ncbi:MAG: L,D-transpeptidase [Magnetococcales bacterium]|nr:L,D-transpeptidase [Magnetococcales bacterium]
MARESVAECGGLWGARMRRFAVLPGILSILLLTILGGSPAGGAVEKPPEASDAWAEQLALLTDSERLLMTGLEALSRQDLDRALDEFDRLVRQRPDFRLARLIYGDLLLARAGALRRFGGTAPPDSEEFTQLLEEARSRVLNMVEHPRKGTIPEPLLYLAKQQTHAIIVDLSKSRLYLFERNRGRPEMVGNYYISSGRNGADKTQAGDKRTPVGLYFITDYLPGRDLPDLYGIGALPINYPNEWDRLNRRSGYGIWLHGTPTETYSRPPRSSDGCVVLTNQDFQTLGEAVGIGTPVMITNTLDWLDPREWKGQLEWFLARIDQWHKDWTSRNPERVLRHYSQAFQNGTFDYSGWSRHVRLLFQQGAGEEDAFSDMSVLGYPADLPMVVVTYTTRKRGADLRGHAMRRQYWRQESDDAWKIVYEDTG